MKIAIFTDTFLPQINGVTNTLRMMMQYFLENGIVYKLFSPHYENMEPDYPNVERFFSVPIFFYPECRLALPKKKTITSSLLSFNPDVILIMTEFTMGLTGMYLAQKFSIPVISNYSTNISQYTGYYKIPFLKQAVWDFMRKFHSKAEVTLCPSNEARSLLEQQGFKNTAVFSRGIDPNLFSPEYRNSELRKQWRAHGKTVLLYVGRVSPEKDLDILIESYNSVYKDFKKQIILVITGDGPLIKKCKNLLPSDTIFTGFKKGAALSQIYASSDIFICPSSTETFGNVVLEAMASGCAVIGCNAGGIGGIIKNRYNGIKFRIRDSKDLAKTIIEMLENKEFSLRLAENGRVSVLNYSWKKVFENLVLICRNVIKPDILSSAG